MSDAGRAFDDVDEPQPKGAGIDRLRAAWGRRKWLAILVFAVPFTAIVTLLAALPNMYRSTATVLVDRQQVPEAFVRPTVTSELEIRLNTISQEILSRSRLEELIRRFGLYADLRGSVSNEEIVERLRRDIRLELKATDQRNRGGAFATVAFALSYQGRDPQTVALVTNTLASFYIDENLKARERQATGTAEFLRVQLAEAKRRLDEQERQVSELRRRYMGELPQQMQSNLATLESLNNQLRLNNDNQQRAAQQRATLAAQLGAAEAASGIEPDSVRLARLKQELTVLRTKYTDLWPDIIRLKDEIARLEAEMAKPKEERVVPAALPTPEVVRLREAVKTVDIEIRLLKADEQRLRRGIAAFEVRVENTPRREQEFQELTRDYETTKGYYQSLLKRYEEATLAESMEQRQKGEQFRILDPAVAAANPTAPNRLRLLLVGLVASLGLAGAALVVAEVLDTSFHSVLELRGVVSVPILARIPTVVTERDWRRRRWRFRLAVVAALVGLCVVSAGSYLVGHGNEQLVQLMSRGERV
jgi:polysaccharide chain length determinant protein (PEP-CTERM system associated)